MNVDGKLQFLFHASFRVNEIITFLVCNSVVVNVLGYTKFFDHVAQHVVKFDYDSGCQN